MKVNNSFTWMDKGKKAIIVIAQKYLGENYNPHIKAINSVSKR